MIQSVRLINYRCFKDSEIRFKPTTIIVGSNNAGKSTLTEALRIIGLVARKYRNAHYAQPATELELPAASKGIYLHLEDLRIDLRTIIYQYQEDIPAEIIAKFDNKVDFHIYLTSEFVYAQIFWQGKNIIRKTDAQKIEQLNLHILPQLNLLQEDEKRLNDDTITKEIETRLSSRHFRNEIYFFRKEAFKQFQEDAQRSWPGLKVQNIEYEIDDNSKIKLFVFDSGYSAEIGMMGSGLQMWLQIIWFISRNNPEATVVLDEPDVYMHPDLQRKLFNMVRTKFKQTIIATHSVEIMAGAEPEQIVTVDKTTRHMSYASNYAAVQDVISNLGSIHNLALSKLGTTRKCVFVEGKDIKMLAKIQARFDPEGVCVDQLPCVELGGWSRFDEALGAARLFFDETKGEIKTFCILDRDYHTDEEIQKLYSVAEENHLHLHIWQKKELENYIVTPESLFRITELPKTEKDEFEQKLFIKLDCLREKTIDSIMDYMQSLDKSKTASFFRKKATDILNDNWSTLHGRLSIVNGKDLISLVNTFMRSEFHVPCSKSKLIQALIPGDVYQEIKETVALLLS